MDEAQHQTISRILLEDPIWSAYALADLEPSFEVHSEWLASHHAVVLIYHRLSPPLLFAIGDPGEVGELIKNHSMEACQFSLLPLHRKQISSSLLVKREIPMWRMVYELGSMDENKDDDLIQLMPSDAESIQRLFLADTDSPDSYLPEQLEIGPFYGIFEQQQLICVAGVHVVSPTYRVAAIGNVYVHPDYRGSGLARRATSRVVSDLIKQGMNRIVLNVAKSNSAAVRTYEGVGFRPAMEYLEGTARLVSSN